MKISGFDRYVEQNDLRSIGAPKIRALSPRRVFFESGACACVLPRRNQGLWSLIKCHFLP